MSPVTISVHQNIILRAAARVDYLPFRARNQINAPYGVWRALVIRGYLRKALKGWEITEEGRTLIRGVVRIRKNEQRRETSMLQESKRPRYAVSRVPNGWAVIDRHISKIKMHNDIVVTLESREKARTKVNELNYIEKHGSEAAE